MKIEEKIKLLNQLGTKSLLEHLTQAENDLQKALTEESAFRNTKHDYLASAGQDCQAVKSIQAELYIQAPGKNAAERDAWVIKQRKENPELQQAITKQREVAFIIDDLRIKMEMAKRRYESTRSVLALRTAQVNFLSGEDKE